MRDAEPDEPRPLFSRLLGPAGKLAGVLVTALVGAIVAAFVTPLGSTPRVAPLLDRLTGRGRPLDITSSFSASWPAAFGNEANAEAFVKAFNEKGINPGKPRMWGGVPATNGCAIVLNVTGDRYQQVRVTTIKIKFVSRSGPIATAFVEPPGGRGGAGDYEVLSFNLDAQEPVGLYTTADGQVTDVPYFQRRNVTLSKDESIHFLLDLTTKAHAVKFTVEVGFEYGNSKNLRHDTETINDDGAPFAFTALAPPTVPEVIGPSKKAHQPNHSGYKYVWLSNPDGSRIVADSPARQSVRR
ncbi:hypothetical protein [Actinoplanes sp. NPDC051411]|uniref:hypothetical protein n=1 Tax=Actinoplanes sp. NPDC051411 TaxID=3155522 RepID=UPI00342C1BC4